MLTLGFGFATFSVPRELVESLWDGKLQEARKPFEDRSSFAA
jgi:hypothetical protein